MTSRCCYCNHKLNVPGDAETRAVSVHRTPPARGKAGDVVVACWLCAQAKNLLTDTEFRKVMGFPAQRKQWLTLLHDAHRTERENAPVIALTRGGSAHAR